MKIGQKGLSTAAIVGIVVTVVVVVTAAAAVFALKGRGPATGVGGLPVYAGATKSGAAHTVTGIGIDVQAEEYTATGSASDILNYYRAEMANAGWTKQYEEMSEGSGTLYFEKGDRGALVIAVSSTGLYVSFELIEGPKTTLGWWVTETMMSTPTPPLIATISIRNATAGSTELTIEHAGGDPIRDAYTDGNWTNMEVRVNGATTPAPSGTGDFSVGDSLTITVATALSSSDVITVIYTPANQQLASVTVP